MAELNPSNRAQQFLSQAQEELDSKKIIEGPSDYLSNTPAAQLLNDPRALADIRNYYTKYEGKSFSDDKEMLEEFHEDQSWSNLNTFGIASQWNDASNAPEVQRNHMARLASLYEKIPSLNAEGGFADHIGGWEQTLNIGQSLLADPINLLGFGAGGMVGKAAARTAMATGKGGMGAGVKAAAKRGAMVEGAIAAPITMGHDAMLQGFQEEVGLRDEYSLSQGLLAGGMGLAAGGAIGAIMGAVAGSFGARIGAKEAQRLLDAGHTPETIPNMSQAEVNAYLSPDATTPNMQRVLNEEDASYDQIDAENAQYDQGIEDLNQQRADQPRIDAEQEQMFDENDALKSDESVIDAELELVQSMADELGLDPRGTADETATLNQYTANLVSLRAQLARIAPRLREVEEKMKAGGTEKEIKALQIEYQKLLDQKSEVTNIRKRIEDSNSVVKKPNDPTSDSPVVDQSAAPIAEEAAPTASTATPAAVEKPQINMIDGEAEAAAREAAREVAGDTADPVLDAVAETAPAPKMGSPVSEISDEAASLLTDMGVKPDAIKKAKNAKTPKPRKRLLKSIIESKNLYETGEDINKLTIREMVARVKKYTDENPVEAVKPAQIVDDPNAPQVLTETAPSMADAAALAREVTSPNVADELASPNVADELDPTDTIDLTTDSMNSDMPTMADRKVIDPLLDAGVMDAVARIKENMPDAGKKTATESATPETVIPEVGEAPAPAPKISDPEPLPLDKLESTTLKDVGITDSMATALRSALGTVEPKFKTFTNDQITNEMTVLQLEDLAVDLTAMTWPKNQEDFMARVEAVRVVEFLRGKLLPNGVQKNTQSRKDAAINIRKTFESYGETFNENAIAFLHRFDDLGYEDKAPIFKMQQRSDHWERSPTRNLVNLSSSRKNKEGVFVPRLATYYHEMAHWMYGNVLTPAQRVEFMDAMTKYYKDGKLDNQSIWDALPHGKFYKKSGRMKMPDENDPSPTNASNNGDSSPQEMFAESFSMFAMRSHASPDAQLESFFAKVTEYFEYLYKRFIKSEGVVDPDLEVLFKNIIPNEKQYRDLFTKTVGGEDGSGIISYKDSFPETDAGGFIKARLGEAVYINSAMESALGNPESVILKMHELKEILFSITSQRGNTGAFRQTASINSELRAASKTINDTIRDFYSDIKDKQGGEPDYEGLETGTVDMDWSAQEELGGVLEDMWEKGGIRELVYKLDDTLRGQYFRHEQKLILSPMAKDSFPESLSKNRKAFKVVLEWQPTGEPDILNPKVTEAAVKAKSKIVPKTPTEQKRSNVFNLKKQNTTKELQELAKSQDNSASIDASIALLEQWKASPSKIPAKWKTTFKEIKEGNVTQYPEMLRNAFRDQANGDANATKFITELRMETYRRALNKKTKSRKSKSEIVIDRLIAKEGRLYSAVGVDGEAKANPVIAEEFINMFTHRNSIIEKSIQTVMWRFLNMLDMDTNSEFLGTQFFDQTTLMMDQQLHFGKIGDANTPYARDALNDVDLNSEVAMRFLKENRRIIAMLSGDTPEKIVDGLRGMARLALRTHIIPPSSKTAILDIYRAQPEAMKVRMRKQLGSAASEMQEMEQFFADSFIHYASGKVPADDNIFKNLTYKESEEVFDILDQVSHGVRYMTDGVVNKSQLVGIFDELAYSMPQGENAVKLQKADTLRETSLHGVDPKTKEAYIGQYLKHLERTNPTRFKLMEAHADSLLGMKDDGEMVMFWHSSANGTRLDRQSNPVLRTSKNGQHGEGLYLTTSDQYGYPAYANRATNLSMVNMLNELVTSEKMVKNSPEYNYILGEIDSLTDAYINASAFAEQIVKKRGHIEKAQADLERASFEGIDGAEAAPQRSIDIMEKQIDAFENGLRENYITTKMLEENLNKSIGLKSSPVMLPILLNVNRVAEFDATMHRMDSDLISSVLGRMQEMESKGVKGSDIQQTISNGTEGGLASQVAIAIRGAASQDANGRISGQNLYDTIVNIVAKDSNLDTGEGGIASGREYLDEILKSLGYEAKVGSTSSMLFKQDADGNMIEGRREYYKETVVFDTKKAKHLAADLFNEDSPVLYNSKSEMDTDAQNPNTALLLAAINSEGDYNHRGFASVVSGMESEGASPSLTSSLVAVAKGKELSVGQSNTLKQYGPKLFFSKGSDRLRSFGMKWLGDFIQPVHGTGFHEKQNSELGRRIIPIIQRIKTLPDSKGVLGTWASKNNPLRTNQPDSVTRIVKTLRRPLGHESEKRLSPEEFAIYRDLRELFSKEAVTLKESGVLMGNIKDYFPQVWNKEAMLRDKENTVTELQKHLMRESINERNSDVTVEQARLKAELIFNRLVDDDGVYMPPPTGGRRDATSDHIDYQRMLRLDKYPDSLSSLEKYLETDLEGMMTKYFDLSTRRVSMANKFGTHSHGFYDYIYTVEHGMKGVVELMTQGKVFSREIVVPDGTNRKLADIETELFKPLTKDPAQARQIAEQALEIAKSQGAIATRDFLISVHPKATQAWEKRADAIANALSEFEGNVGMIPEKEFKHAQGIFNVTQRKPVSPQDTFFKQSNNTSKVLRSVNAVSLLGWTTLTSLGDLALPLVRSGNFRAWANGMRKWASDPDYRQAIQSVGVAVENLTHERLTGLVGADSTKATNAFFNFTLLTPWTNMNREMAGAVFHQAIITEQRRALTADQGSNKYRTAMRFLNRYGLADYAKDGAKDLNDPRVLADDDAVREGMIRFANESIFTPNSNDVPVWAQTPWGSVIFQLKSFPLMMQRLTLGEGGVGSEAMKGNVYPALYALTIGAGFGMASLGSKDVVQSRGGEEGTSMELRNRNLLKSLGYDKKVHGDADDFAGWYYESLMQMGGLGLLAGIMHDSAQQLDNGAYGQMRVASTVFGPSVGLFGSAYNVAAGGWDATKDLMGSESTNSKERQAIRALVERVPVAGGVKGIREAVVDTVAGETESGSSSSSSSGWGSGGWGS